MLALLLQLAANLILALFLSLTPPGPDQTALAADSHLTGPAVYLTFDADMTEAMRDRQLSGEVKSWYDPDLIEYLEKENIPSSIFVTGLFAETNPDLIRTLAADTRFKLGNHTYDHRAFEPSCYRLPTAATERDKQEEINRTQEALASLGIQTNLFRFPGLCQTTADTELVKSLGLTPVGADVVSQDAFNRNAEAISQRITNSARGGSVILLHLGGPNAPATLEALRLAVPELKARGFIFKTL